MKVFLLASLILLCIIPHNQNAVRKDTSDFVEINHVYRYDEGDKVYKKRMVQIIWWDWKDYVLLPVKDRLGRETGDWRPSGCFVVKDYRVVWSESSRPQQTLTIVPRRNGARWVCIFYDKDHRVFREVTSGWMRETHTTNDPEIEDRQIFAKENRRELRGK